MQAMLNRHPEIYVLGETHYFDDLRVRSASRERVPLVGDAQKLCEDYFLALQHRPYGHGGDPEKSRLSREDLARLAKEEGNTPDGYFEAYGRAVSAMHGKARWGEKTPRHVYRINEILECFPGAKVICMVRDPRAVVASYRDWRNQGGFDFEADPGHLETLKVEAKRAKSSYHVILQTWLWRGTVQASLAARARWGADHVSVQRYENFVLDPEPITRELAAWLNLDFDPAMLEVPVTNSSFSSFEAKGGMQQAAIDRWREKLSAGEIATVQSCSGTALQGAGYEAAAVQASLAARAWPWLTLPFAGLRAVMANRERIGNIPAYIWKRIRLASGSVPKLHDGNEA